MEILLEKTLENGDILTVSRWVSSEPAPRRYCDYILASFGMDHPHSNLYTINGWRGYFCDAMAGNFYPEVVDYWFFAEINGEFAGRIWFAYSARSGRGNFGNVMTEPKFRKRGIMTELMKYFCEEFHRSPARMLCCATGNRFAAASYLKYGFKFIYTGPTGPLCIMKEGDFHAEAAKAFAVKEIAKVRSGTIGDQFDCDKFLTYIPEIWRRRLPFPAGTAGFVEDYRLALQEQYGGRGVVCVAENPQGEAVGFAYACLAGRIPTVDFVIHPDSMMRGGEKLLAAVCEAFRAGFPGIPSLLYTGYGSDGEKNRLVSAAGGIKEAAIADIMTYGEETRDMAIYRFPL